MADIRFGTDGWRAIIADGYTFENLARVVWGTAEWLKTISEQPTVMIGYDTRFQGRAFAEHAATVFATCDIQVFLSHRFVSTPMVSLATHKRQVDAGIVITASHNPASYSGFKVRAHYGGPALPDMIAEIEKRVPGTVPDSFGTFDQHLEAGKIKYFDMEAVYLNHVREVFDLKAMRKSGLQIGYDAMFGAGQAIFPKILPQAKTLHCEINPSFRNTPPEPIARNLEEFLAFAKAESLDIGIATDGDADRIGLVGPDGEFIDAHHVILLLIYYFAGHKGMKGKIVTTFSCSDKIRRLCAHYGLPHEVTPIGFKHICGIMLEESVLVGGGEPGGIAVTGHVPERDGIFVGLTLLEFMCHTGKSLLMLISEVHELVGSFAYERKDLRVSAIHKVAIIQACEERTVKCFGTYQIGEIETLDGFKFYLPDYPETWLMIRSSGTEPVLRVYCEGPSSEIVSNILAQTIETLHGI